MDSESAEPPKNKNNYLPNGILIFSVMDIGYTFYLFLFTLKMRNYCSLPELFFYLFINLTDSIPMIAATVYILFNEYLTIF